jgi:hypothetical protein
VSYEAHLREHRRLAILRLLAEAPEFKANESILSDSLNSLGVPSSRSDTRTDLHWLREQGLVGLEDLGRVTVAILMERGADVAAGRATEPGVRKPTPKASG